MKSLLRAILSCGVGCCLAAQLSALEPAAAAPATEGADIVVPTGIQLEPTTKSDAFVPDVFPSEIDAARALGKRWGQAVQVGSATVDVESSSKTLAHAFSEGMGLANPMLRVATSTGDVRVSLSKALATQPDEEVEESQDDSRVRSGTVTLKVIDRSDAKPGVPTAPMSERFVEKPWLADFAGFVTAHSGSRWIVGKSDPLRPALTPAEAARAAREAAANEVVRVLQAKLAGELGRHNDHRAREAVMTHLVDGTDLVADRFPQAFDRSYGTVYREAVLINASHEALQPLVDEVLQLDGRERHSRGRAFAGGLAAMLVTFVLYRLANFVTRGYFTWRLRTVAAIAVAGALLVLAHLP